MVTKPAATATAAATSPGARLWNVAVKVKAAVRFKGLNNREQQELTKIKDIVDRAELKRDMAVDDVQQGLTHTEERLRQRFAAALNRHSNMNERLMENAKLGAFDGRRADSVLAGAPVVDQLRGPTDDEQWRLGVDIVHLQTRLDKIARGGATPDPTSHLALPSYPAQRPSKPTWKAIVQKNMHVLADSRSLMVKAKVNGLLPGLWDRTTPGTSEITTQNGVPAAAAASRLNPRPHLELTAAAGPEAVIKHLRKLVTKGTNTSSVEKGRAATITTTTTAVGSAEVPILITRFSTQFSTPSSFLSQRSCEV